VRPIAERGPAARRTPAAETAGLSGPIMLVAGEASGDLHGATLARALRSLHPDCAVVGMGGRRMADAGVEILADLTSAAAVGGTEAVGRVPALFRAYRTLSAAIAERRPAALVLIDFPEFNLRLARTAKRAGVPVAYFIPPQIWAWRARRVVTIRRLVSLVLAVFPFEQKLYRDADVPVAFVGHPVLDALRTAPSRLDARRGLGLAGDAPVVGLLPGSRREEIDRVFPVMRDAARRIASRHPDARFILGLAPTVTPAAVARHFDEGPPIALVEDGAYAVMRASDVLLVTSGTATLEAALLGTPMVVCYRFSKLSEAMIRLLIQVPWISLVNIVLGRMVVPELYQKQATAARVATAALTLLDDGDARRAQRDAFVELARELGEPDVGARAARHVLELAGVR
jgi:lipid-A-disaccharide synthase